tara:strand:+ start:6153 stop:6734 length:582 start_codon:yes stop_codon:yes gene_type:complete
MLNQLSEIAPAGAISAIALWAGLSYFVTGPEVATRIANADYVEACEVGLEDGLTASSQAQIDATREVSELERQAQAAQNHVNGLRRQYGGHFDAFDRLSGGALSRTIRDAQRAAEAAARARDRARQALEARRDAAIASAPDQCTCQVTAALNDSRNDWAFYAGSFGIIEQSGVTEFVSLMRSNARMCAERVQL